MSGRETKIQIVSLVRIEATRNYIFSLTHYGVHTGLADPYLPVQDCSVYVGRVGNVMFSSRTVKPKNSKSKTPDRGQVQNVFGLCFTQTYTASNASQFLPGPRLQTEMDQSHHPITMIPESLPDFYPVCDSRRPN